MTDTAAIDRAMAEPPHGKEPTDDIWEAMFSQRAIRYWQDRPVPRELLEKVIAAAAKAPSGTNTQPWVFVIADDGDKRKAIAKALLDNVGQSEAMKALFEQGKASDDKTFRLMLTGAEKFFTELEKAPAIIVPCLYQLSSPTTDPTSIGAGSSIYLAVQNLLLAARALGLGTVMTTAQNTIDKELREILNLPDDAYPVALIPIGFPDANFGKTTRKPVAEILRFNSW